MPDPRAIHYVIRYLAVMCEREGGSEALDNHQFYSLQLFDALAAGGFDPTHALSLMSFLEAEGLIRVIARAGEDGVGFTHFLLTPRGYEIGNPELHKGGLSRITGPLLSRALYFSASTLGIVGGPLALAGVLEPFITWRAPIEFFVNYWREKVTQPIQAVASAPFIHLGIDPLPLWAIEYITIGVLVTASIHNVLRTHRDLMPLPPEPQPQTLMSRVFWFALNGAFMVLIWPVSVLREMIPNIVGAYYYTFCRNDIPVDILVTHPPRLLLARFFAFAVPVIVFLVLFLVNLLYR